MIRIRTWLGTLSILSLSWSVVWSGVAYDERVLPEFDDRPWVAGHANATSEGVIVEYVLEGQNVEEWTELVTTMFFPVRYASGVVASIRDYYKKNCLKQCPNVNWDDVLTSGDKIISIWDIGPCRNPDETEYTMTCFMQGIDYLHVLMYAAREKDTFEKNRATWRGILENARAFRPDDSKEDVPLGHLADSSTMISVEYRVESPAIPNSSFAAQPKRLWRLGRCCTRLEESPDVAGRVHGLMISNAPDCWMINLLDGSGRHFVDPGPTYNSIVPVFGDPQEEGLSKLELGNERAFFEYYGARALPDETIGSVECQVLELPRLYWVLRLYARKDNGLPYRITRRGPDGSTMAVCYDEYRSNLAIDAKLFQPPGNVRITEN